MNRKEKLDNMHHHSIIQKTKKKNTPFFLITKVVFIAQIIINTSSPKQSLQLFNNNHGISIIIKKGEKKLNL